MVRKVKKNILSNPLKSEVMNKTRTEDKINHNVFANITHKNSSGENNWKQFSKIMEKSKMLVSNKSQVRTSNKITKSKCKSSHSVVSKCKPTIDRTQINKLDSNKMKSPAEVSCVTSMNIMKKNNVNSSDSSLDYSKNKLTKHIAMDCEMVGVEIGVNKNMLARISLVNSNGDCIYDKFVKPTEPVLDYRTRVSGVRAKDLENATEFKIVQKEVADILKGRILVGHALKNDLKVLYLSHPKHSIRDTSRFRKFKEGKTPALKKLAKKYLGATIQEGEHSSVQDALAAMQLYKMFKKDWETSIHSKKRQVKKSEKETSSHSNLISATEV